ncbi:proton-coupled amino acid transporter-like protein CG1139 [Orussus abietinus]|uniref:proton-coupled amino acid transporter-like protein CG1139 n=1 Tax=Orussus abietinus TaxID=222816 RepID=UPI0006258404|nr:proton-coupled amino acid transporter-like protein CG1139 [Orussus abietinus]
MSHDNLGFTSSTEAVDVKPLPPTGKDYPRSKIFVAEVEEKKNYLKDPEQPYEPYENRDVQHPTTNSETLLHLLKGSLGTGILAMPKAFANAGYVVGLIGTVVIGLLCTYCIHLLIKAQYELCRRKKVPSLSYPATAEAALSEGPKILRRFSKSAVHVVNIFLLIYQLGACCVYVVFIAQNLKSALDSFVTPIDERLYMLALLLPLILINWVRNLKYLAPFSTIANAITLVSFGIILYYIFRVPPSLEKCDPIGKVENFPLFFGTVLFALEAIGVIMPLENEMKTPRSFGKSCGVLNIGMSTIILLYVGMGFFGYMRYGNGVKGSITLSLSDDEIPAKVVQILLALAIYVTHALQCYVAVDICWNDYLGHKFKSNSHKLFWEYFVRTCLVLVTFLLAVAIPELELFISLFGALCLSALGLAFPAIIQSCTFWNVIQGNEKILMLAKNTSLVLFGILGLIVGTYTSLRDIITTFS